MVLGFGQYFGGPASLYGGSNRFNARDDRILQNIPMEAEVELI